MADLRHGTTAHPGTPRRVRLNRLARSFRDAGRGVAAAWREQPNLRLHALVAAAALLAALWLGTGLVTVLLCTALVISLELMNSAVEAVVDLVSPQHHPLAGLAKDLAAGAVLVAVGLSVVIGLLTLGPALLERLVQW